MTAHQADLSSKTWILIGHLGSAPGLLSLEGERLRFTLVDVGTLWGGQLRKLGQEYGCPDLDTRLEGGEAVELIDVPTQQIRAAKFPWYYFNGGMALALGNHKVRFSFLEPQNARWPDERLTGERLLTLKGDLTEGRNTGRAWRGALRG